MTPTPRESLDISRAVCEKIHRVIEPVVDLLGTPTFGYRKFFSNGLSFGISNNLKWTDFCLTHFAQKIISNYEKEVRGALTGEKHCYFRVGTLNSQDPFLSALYDLNIWNTCSLYRKTVYGVEAFYFASTRDNESIIERYTNNKILFERFAHYFKEKLLEMMSLDEMRRAASSTISPEIFKLPPAPSDERKHLTSFLSLTPIHKFFLPIEDKEIVLSFQEVRSLSLLSQGKTAKEVGRKMGISPRTVEGYVENVRRKAGNLSRGRLIELFVSSFEYDQDLLKYLTP